jgi:zinc-ribbon domain
MAIFCTKCGTSNEDGAGFCDNCGAPLRAALAKTPDGDVASQPPNATGRTVSPGSVTKINPKKMIYAGAALAILLILGSGAMYFILQPPAATPSTLLAAAKAGYGKETTDRFKRELCISNIDYSKSIFNAGENDRRTQAWLNALVTAGLYSPPVAINSGGFFAQTLLQYVATPELEKYRQGGKLCVAKDVEFAGVTDIGKPVEESLAQNGKPPTVLLVKTKLLLQSVNTAPWMATSEVRDAVMPTIDGWEYKDKVLQKQVEEVFGLKDNKWTTGIAYKATLEKQIKSAQRGNSSGDDQDSSGSAKRSGGGFAAKLSGLFSFGHPLKGTWRTAAQDIVGFGVKSPAGTGPNLTFTSDSMESMGQSTNVDFSVDGKRVKVTPKGQSQSLIFIIEDSNTMVAQAMGNIRYERVK